MKNKLRRLQLILKIFNPDKFYSITFRQTCIELQGHYSDEIVKKAIELKFESKITDNGHIELNRSDIYITLTE